MKVLILTILAVCFVFNCPSATASSSGLDIFTISRPDVDSGWGRPVNLGDVINTASNEGSPDISADGLTLFFDSNRSGGRGVDDIWLTTRPDVNSPWGAPQNELVYNSPVRDGGPSISDDGLLLFFHSTRSGGSGGWDIWYSVRPTIGGLWSTPKNAGSNVNTGVDDWTPEVSLVDDTLYFASRISGQWKLFSAEIVSIDLGSSTIVFNSAQEVGITDAVAPTVSQDGLTLYYESVFENEIYYVTRASIGSPWSSATQIQIATSSNEAPSISSDDLTLYYMSVDQLGINVSPSFYDFGDVEVGFSISFILIISNVGDNDLTVSDVRLDISSDPDYALTDLPILPVVLLPDGVIDVEITYSPTVSGLSSATVLIDSDDPDEPVVSVELVGAGVITELPPDEQIAQVLDFYEASVTDGSLVGSGPGQSAGRRLNALNNMLESAGDLIESMLYDEARQQLESAYKKTDGFPKPPDFVAGPAASELSAMIQDLITDLTTQ